MNNTLRILVIGATGATGQALCSAILKHSDFQLNIAARKQEKLDMLENKLAALFPSSIIKKFLVNVESSEELLAAMNHSEIAVLTINDSTQMSLIRKVAIQSKTDLLDIFLNPQVAKEHKKHALEIEQNKRLFITQGGFHPGLPAPFIRYMARKFEIIEDANIATAMHTLFGSPEAATEILDELSYNEPSVLENGTWRKFKYSDTRKFTFGFGFGEKDCFPLPMSEIYPLSDELGIKNMAVYGAGFNFFIDNVVFPVTMIVQKINKKWGTKLGSYLTYHSLKRSYDGAPRIEFRLEISGISKGKRKECKLIAQYTDGYDFTVFAIVACLKQYAINRFGKQGVHHMGLIVDPHQLIKDLKEMGIQISEEC